MSQLFFIFGISLPITYSYYQSEIKAMPSCYMDTLFSLSQYFLFITCCYATFMGRHHWVGKCIFRYLKIFCCVRIPLVLDNLLLLLKKGLPAMNICLVMVFSEAHKMLH